MTENELRNKGMELEKETYIEMMQEFVSDMCLEDKPLEWLKEKRARLIISIADCERSAKEIRNYIVNECDGRDTSSEVVKELKDKLVDAIELEAELEKVIAKAIDAELDKRLETK